MLWCCIWACLCARTHCGVWRMGHGLVQVLHRVPRSVTGLVKSSLPGETVSFSAFGAAYAKGGGCAHACVCVRACVYPVRAEVAKRFMPALQQAPGVAWLDFDGSVTLRLITTLLTHT